MVPGVHGADVAGDGADVRIYPGGIYHRPPCGHFAIKRKAGLVPSLTESRARERRPTFVQRRAPPWIEHYNLRIKWGVVVRKYLK